MHPYFSLFGLKLPAYGFMLTVGILSAFLLYHFLRKHSSISEDDHYSAMIVILLSGLAGSKLLFWIVELDTIIKDPSFLKESLTSGFVYYGAFIGALIGVFVFTKIKKQSFFDYMDLYCPGIALGQGFGRIGCFLAGCCYGAPTDSACSVVFPAGIGSAAPAGIPLIPTQLYESAFCFILAAFLSYVYIKEKRLGTTLGFYCVLYSIWRFVIEFFRYDERGTVGTLSTSQFISIFTALLGILLLVFLKKMPLIQREPAVCEGSSEDKQEDDVPEETCSETVDDSPEDKSETAENIPEEETESSPAADPDGPDQADMN